jgi:hypothetical protein
LVDVNLEPHDVKRVKEPIQKYATKYGLGAVKVVFFRDVTKVNRKGKEQKRTLVVADNGIYNLDGTTVKRFIPYDKNFTIVLSCTFEDVIVIEGGQTGAVYDYLIKIKDRIFFAQYVAQTVNALFTTQKREMHNFLKLQ